MKSGVALGRAGLSAVARKAVETEMGYFFFINDCTENEYDTFQLS